jgi:hypothetical protein
MLQGQDRRQFPRQRLGDDAPGCFGIRRLPDRAQCQNLVSPDVDACQQVKTAVNNTPGQIAAERTDQHRSDIDVGPGRNAEGADEGERHDQAEQGLRDPFHRIQHVTGRSV